MLHAGAMARKIGVVMRQQEPALVAGGGADCDVQGACRGEDFVGLTDGRLRLAQVDDGVVGGETEQRGHNADGEQSGGEISGRIPEHPVAGLTPSLVAPPMSRSLTRRQGAARSATREPFGAQRELSET